MNFKAPVRFIFPLLVLAALLPACSKYQKLLKSTDMEAKYEAAVQYYNEKDYYRAMPLFEELLSAFRGTLRAEDVYYYFAYSHYGQADYIMASHHFQNFIRSFPRSKHAEEVNFMYAYCHYLQSPTSSLDQQHSKKALTELQLFVNRYPTSERVAQCNQLIDKLRFKLERKAYDNAYLYYKTGNYQAAAIAFKNTIQAYPTTPLMEETLFLAFKSSYLYAKNSTERRKADRYRSALTEYRNFVNHFQDSQFSGEAKSIEESIREELEKLEPIKEETKL